MPKMEQHQHLQRLKPIQVNACKSQKVHLQKFSSKIFPVLVHTTLIKEQRQHPKQLSQGRKYA